MNHLDSTLLRAYARTSVGRMNDYAVQRPDGRYARVGALLTYEALRLHLEGAHTIGSYVISETNTCRFAVFDADDPAGFLALVNTQRRLASDGVPAHLELSRRPGHLRVFFASPLSPLVVRRWLLPYCPPGVEFYPKQDVLDVEHPYGSLMRLPLGVHRLTGRWYPFVTVEGEGGQLVPVAQTRSASLAWLASAPRATPPPSLLGSTPLQQPAPDVGTDTRQDTLQKRVGALPARTQFSTIADWCRAHDPVQVIGRYVSLDERGVGCCPFGEHHAKGYDSRPSLWVHPLRGDELVCWWCHTWQRGGSLFDFLRLYYGLDARSLWQRIRAGGQL